MRQSPLPYAPILFATLLASGCGGTDESGSSDEITLDDSQGGESAREPSSAPELVVGEGACESDADCVPAGCCHAAACVSRADAPDCADAICTTDCQFGTLDCGGACLCHEGRCAARLSAPPDL